MLQMLQNLLSERFHLQSHRETQDLPGYALELGKSGLKIATSEGQISAPAMQTSSPQSGVLRVTARKQRLRDLAGYLSVQLQSPVADRTGVDGEFDFTFEFESPQLRVAQSNGPTIFTAVQELGLHLEAQKVPGSVLIVDSVDRKPTEN
jgi:uncharacterized protein (TIGR03435 family)